VQNVALKYQAVAELLKKWQIT